MDGMRYRPAFPPVEEEEHRRQGINDADGAELVNGEDRRSGVIAEVMHDAVVGGQHARRRSDLKEIDHRAVPFEPGRDRRKVFRRKGAEHEDE